VSEGAREARKSRPMEPERERLFPLLALPFPSLFPLPLLPQLRFKAGTSSSFMLFIAPKRGLINEAKKDWLDTVEITVNETNNTDSTPILGANKKSASYLIPSNVFATSSCDSFSSIDTTLSTLEEAAEVSEEARSDEPKEIVLASLTFGAGSGTREEDEIGSGKGTAVTGGEPLERLPRVIMTPTM